MIAVIALVWCEILPSVWNKSAQITNGGRSTQYKTMGVNFVVLTGEDEYKLKRCRVYVNVYDLCFSYKLKGRLVWHFSTSSHHGNTRVIQREISLSLKIKSCGRKEGNSALQNER